MFIKILIAMIMRKIIYVLTKMFLMRVPKVYAQTKIRGFAQNTWFQDGIVHLK